MTAMCDVSFLLLTFFILTATARQPDPLEVSIPSSTYVTKVPDENNAILSIGKGKVFFEVAGQNVRENALRRMGEKYSITFTPEEVKRFSVIGSFGVPIENLKKFIAMSSEERSKTNIQTGIPLDSLNNQLNEWIFQARYAVKELNGVDMRVSIKGDSKEEYPAVKKVVDILQKQKLNKFLLITSSEGGAPKE